MQVIETSQELLQCYDEQGAPSESRVRAEVKQQPPRWWYGVARIWLVNDLGQLMCSRRSMSVSANPGKWQPFFGGHVGAGQTFAETAQKELLEEAGLDRPLAEFALLYRGRIESKKVLFESFIIRFNGASSDLNFSDNEVSESKWISIEECSKDCRENSDRWSNVGTPEEWASLRALISDK